MKKRNPAICLILTILTCGIYGLYWFVQLHNAITQLADPPKKTGGGTALLLTLITCGIYGLYWVYTMARLQDRALAIRQLPPKNQGVLFLILQFIGLGIVNWILLQSTVNALLEPPMPQPPYPNNPLS